MNFCKSKKIKLGIITVFLMIVTVILFWSIKSTATSDVKYTVKIKELREDSKLGYAELRVGGNGIERSIKIWNLVKVNEDGKDEEVPLYCLQAELGFASDTTATRENSDPHTVTYTKKFDMKLRGDKKILNDGSYDNENENQEGQKLIIENKDNDQKYSRVVWLADNMYIPNDDTAQDKIAILRKSGVINDDELEGYTTEVKKDILTKLKEKEKEHHIIDEDLENLSNEEIDELFYSKCFISDDIMETVQQLAFWYIIHENDEEKKENYHHAELPELYCTEQEETEQNNGLGQDSYKALKKEYSSKFACGGSGSDAIFFEIGERYQDNAETYYKWLITEIDKQTGTEYYDKVSYETSPYDDEGNSKVAVKLKTEEADKNNIKVIESGDNYIVGPYVLERVTNDPFSIEAESLPNNCKILKESGNEKVNVSTLEEVVGNSIGTYNFYIQIPKTQDISNVNVKIKVKSNNRLVNLFLGENAQKEQPVLLVENKTAEEEFSVDIVIKGTFKFKLVKYLEGISDITLKDAKFRVSIKEDGSNEELVKGNNGENVFTTDANGSFEIDNLNISGPNKKYIVTVTETEAPEGYIGIDGPITFEATSKLNDEGNAYVLNPETKQVANAKKVDIKEGEILVEAENKPEIHKGVKEIYNQDSGYDGDEVQEWVIHTKVPSDLEKYGKFEVTDPIDNRLDFQGTDNVEVAIVTMEGNDVKKEEKVTKQLIKDTNYKIDFDENTKTLKVTFVDKTKNSDNSSNNFYGLKDIKAGSIISIRFKTKFAVDENGKIIALNQSVPNQAKLTYGNTSNETKQIDTEIVEVHTGKTGVYKYNEKTGVALEGAEFKIAKSEADAKAGIFVKDHQNPAEDLVEISGADGYAWFEGLEFGEDAMDKVKETTIDEITGAEVYRYNWEEVETKYYIVETKAPEGFEKVDDVMEVTVKKDAGDAQEVKDQNSVKNNLKPGSFKLNLVKYLEGISDITIKDAGFTVSILDEKNKELIENPAKVYTTDDEGKFEIDGLEIEDENKTYTITVTETKVPEGYIGLEGPITFTAKSKLSEDGKKYVLVSQTPTVTNAKKVVVNEDEILIEAENRPTIHKGVKDIQNQDSGYNGDEKHDWVIQTKVPVAIDKYGKYVVTDEIDERLVFCGYDDVTVKILNGKDLVKDTDYKVNYDEKTRILKISFIEDKFEAGKKFNPGDTLEIRFKTTFALDEEGNIIALDKSVPNQATLIYGNSSDEEKELKTEIVEVHTGKTGVYKYNKVTGVALEGAKFKIAKSEEDAKNGIFVKDAEGKDIEVTSNSEGIAMFYGLEFGEDALNIAKYKTIDEITGAEVYKYDWEKVETKYYIVETEAPKGFNKINDPIEVTVKKDSNEVIEIEDLVSVANVPITGFYQILINKVDGSGNYLSGVEFTTEGKETSGTVDVEQEEPKEEAQENENKKEQKVEDQETEKQEEQKVEDQETEKQEEQKVEDQETEKQEEQKVEDQETEKQESKKSETEEQENIAQETEKQTSEETVIAEEITTPIVTDGTGNAKEIVSRNIKAENVDLVDKYTITETKTKDGYHKLVNPITVEVYKAEIDQEEGKAYAVSKFSVNGEEVKDELTLKVDLEGTEEKATITLTRTDNVLKIVVENIEKKGNYKILLNKVNEKGEYLAGVKFEIVGKDSEEKVIEDGITSPIETDGKEKAQEIVSREINEDNVKLIDTYTITETETKEGYYKLKNPITVKIEKAYIEDEYQINKVTVNEQEVENEITLEAELEETDQKAKITISKQENTLNIVVENIPVEKKFDLALRKVIVKVTDEDGNVKDIVNIDGEDNKRKLVEDTTNLYKTVDGTLETTAKYNHRKDPVLVEEGDIITYELRIYNEGEAAGRATKIVDALPKGLEFVEVVDGDYKAKQADKWLILEKQGENNLNPFDGEKLDCEVVTIKCKVVAEQSSEDTVLTNIAFIDEEYNSETDTVITNEEGQDEDSEPYTFPTEVTTGEMSNYTGDKSNDSDLTKNDYYYKGEQDDDDFEKLVLKKKTIFDLALRKFITEVEGVPVNNRYPEVKEGTDGRDFNYEHTKEPVEVVSGNTVIYTIRIFNEGTTDGYASEVMDDLPEGIVFLPEHQTNVEYRWVMYKETTSGEADYEYAGKKYVKTDNANEADIIVTDYLDKEISEAQGRDSLLKAYDKEKGITDGNPDYRDVKVAFKVTEANTSDRIIVNTAEISRDEDKDGNEVIDEDSTPGNGEENEDDIDKEYLKLKYFDLALLKWVSQVSVTQDGKTTVTDTGHTVETARDEDPVLVTIDSKKLDSVVVKFIYDIRVENQGEIEGYATELKDHIPEGLKFVAEDNPDWEQVDENTITTNALKDTLLQPGDTASVRVVLTWINGADNVNLKVNYAEISEDYNEWGIPDIDSTPDNWENTPGEDDDDEAPVLLTLKTGQMPVYFILGFGILAVATTGIYFIKKYVYDRMI